MLTFVEFNPQFALFNQLRRQMDRVFEDFEVAPRPEPSEESRALRFNLFDSGTELVLKSDLPGVSEADVTLTLNDTELTVRGERKADVPEGYATHRKERGSTKFARTVALPCRVDAERSKATFKDGVLTITLSKAPESQSRTVRVQAS